MVRVLQTTQNLVILSCCFAEDAKEIYRPRIILTSMFLRARRSVEKFVCYCLVLLSGWAFRTQISSVFLYTAPPLWQENHPLFHNHTPHVSFAGFDVVTLANNHLNDFGSKGANYTVQVLKKAGLKYFGVSYGKYSSSQVSRLDSYKRYSP